MISREGEIVKFTKLSLLVEGSPETWLKNLEKVMRNSIRKLLEEGISDFVYNPKL